MLARLDNLLNRITMYKLILWDLRILAGIAFVLSFFHVLHEPFWGMAVSLALLSVTSQLANMAMARAWKVPTNTESYAITLLILFFLLQPPTTARQAIFIVVAAVIAVLSKFIIAVQGRHIFNPAAFAAIVVGLIGFAEPIWWVGSKPLWPFVLVLGLLVVRKIRRFTLFLTFGLASLVGLAVAASLHGQTVGHALILALTSSPLLFLGTIMLTEPATMPGKRRQQVIFALLVAVLYSLPWQLGSLHVPPEMALLVGNLYAFFVNPHYRLKLRLQEVQHVSGRVSNYVFTPDRKARFTPGQYMEFTLDMPRHDGRGNRRTFSLASSPTEQTIQLGVKFYEPSSRFKQVMRELAPGSVLYAGSVAGDFSLPADKSEKLAFIAGGIGITPFRSMLKYLLDTGETRDITMIYAVSDPAEVAYKDVLNEATARGVRIIPLLTADPSPDWQGKTGQLTHELVAELIPDHQDRAFYLSGPQPMIEVLQSTIHKLGAKSVKTDYFAGY